MTITREQEIWAWHSGSCTLGHALWVDREHGEDAEQFIAGKVLHVEETGYAGRSSGWRWPGGMSSYGMRLPLSRTE